MVVARPLRIHATAFIAVFPLTFSLSGFARAEEAPETFDPAASCADGGCHSEVAKHDRLHWSDFAKPGECQKCHEPDGNLHDFSVGDAPDLCYSCHEDIEKKIRSSDVVHDAAEDCLDCHDAHGGKVEGILNDVSDEDNLKPLCFTCHDEDEVLAEEYTHGPVDQGSCTECHDPHAAPRASLLRADVGLDLCGRCHEEVAEEIKTAKYVHDPVSEGCTDCHNPHSSPHPKLLLEEKRKLCNECHDDIVDLAESATVDHEATTKKDECLNCHAAHASNYEPNLKAPLNDLCLGCHDRRVESGDSVLIDMKGWLSDHPLWHEPIREDGCASCHEPHGSENRRLLAKAFPKQFYAKFELRSYRLCFSCHEERMVMQKQSRTATGFRDGDRNLHYLHVNRAKKGRTCRACHDLHASDQPLLIGERVRFGGWLMPLNYEKAESGGSCLPGCHKLRAYDREATSQRTRE